MAEIWRVAASIIAAGGWVMYPLLALSVVSVTLSVERALFWIGSLGPGRRRASEQTASLARSARFAEAMTAAKADPSVFGRFAAGVLGGVEPGVSPPAVESLAAEQAESLRPTIERFGTVMSTIVAGAPLLGILGTVLGIIESFRLIGDAGPITDPTAVAAGIATALYTTALGLIVALITLFPHAVFRARADRCLGRFEAIAASITAGVERAARMDARPEAQVDADGGDTTEGDS